MPLDLLDHMARVTSTQYPGPVAEPAAVFDPSQHQQFLRFLGTHAGVLHTTVKYATFKIQRCPLLLCLLPQATSTIR
jgi:hypothetical protein